jgi:hypothetical protein
MMIHMNGPEMGEADDVLKTALDLHFKGQPWHFTYVYTFAKLWLSGCRSGCILLWL